MHHLGPCVEEIDVEAAMQQLANAPTNTPYRDFRRVHIGDAFKNAIGFSEMGNPEKGFAVIVYYNNKPTAFRLIFDADWLPMDEVGQWAVIQ